MYLLLISQAQEALRNISIGLSFNSSVTPPKMLLTVYRLISETLPQPKSKASAVVNTSSIASAAVEAKPRIGVHAATGSRAITFAIAADPHDVAHRQRAAVVKNLPANLSVLTSFALHMLLAVWTCHSLCAVRWW